MHLDLKTKEEVLEEIIYYKGEKYGHVEVTPNMLDQRIYIGDSIKETMKDIPVINGLEDIEYFHSELYHFYLTWFED